MEGYLGGNNDQQRGEEDVDVPPQEHRVHDESNGCQKQCGEDVADRLQLRDGALRVVRRTDLNTKRVNEVCEIKRELLK
jgi:hypothetical protein